MGCFRPISAPFHRCTRQGQVSQCQTVRLRLKDFDCHPRPAYNLSRDAWCCLMNVSTSCDPFRGGTMTRKLGSVTLVAVLFLSTGIRAQESASSGIIGQVVDTTKGAMP